MLNVEESLQRLESTVVEVEMNLGGGGNFVLDRLSVPLPAAAGGGPQI